MSIARTSRPACICASCRRRRRGSFRGLARTRASSTSATGWPASSRWRATTTRPTSSPTRARRRASAASCATCSPWARGRWRASICFASARPSIRRRAILWPASSRASAVTGIRSACPRSAARSISTRATTATFSSTPWRWASRRRTRFSTPRRRASDARSSISARRPAATASTARRWRRLRSRPMLKKSARPCRSAIRSRKSCCSKPASKSWRAGA